VVHTRTLRGLLCSVLGAFAGTLVWLLISAISALLYPMVWAWAQLASRLRLPFDEGRSITWCGLMVAGSVVAFVTIAGLWPQAEAVAGQVVAGVATSVHLAVAEVCR
jgi:small-conductance mechanosensitive channel